MALPEIVSRDRWIAARKELLVREKELTRERDALNADRRRLPMVRMMEDYVFDGPDGPVGLLDLFDGRRQLVMQHVMFGPDWDEPCPSCSAGLDELSPALLRHLRARETNFVAVSRAPFSMIAPVLARRGWSFPWYSSHRSTFNFDFHVSLDAGVAPVLYNYQGVDELRAAGKEWLFQQPNEQPAVSCFLRDGDAVFHTYSTFARGTDQLGGAYTYLDLTALGRQEEWEEPKDRVDNARVGRPDFAE